jgi:hypothetical protein
MSDPANNVIVQTKPPPLQFSLRSLFAITAWCALVAFLATLNIPAAVVFAPLSATALRKSQLRDYSSTVFWSLISIMGALFAICLFGMPSYAHESARIVQCKSNMHNIGLALHAYHEAHGHYPPAYIADANGKPMHSWRVLILPYLNQQPLFDAYRMDEPWDGPNNSKLQKWMPPVYRCPSDKPVTNCSSYLAVVGMETAWPNDQFVSNADFKNGDGAANTIQIVESSNSGINWMEPRDLDFKQIIQQVKNAQNPHLGSSHPHSDNVLLADGSIHWLEKDTSEKRLKALLTIRGGEKEPVELP